VESKTLRSRKENVGYNIYFALYPENHPGFKGNKDFQLHGIKSSKVSSNVIQHNPIPDP
jgi:hypothetical protein